MSNFTRLIKHFQKNGIAVEATAFGWNVRNAHAQANILLPHDFALEDKAVQQLLNFASVHPSACACATPDFHPGTHAPVGCVVATDADVVIPRAIGTDINCGMRTLKTGLNLGQMGMHEKALQAAMADVLLHNHRNVPLRTDDFHRLYSQGPQAFLHDWAKREGQLVDVNSVQRALEWERHVGLLDWDGHARHAPLLHTASEHGWIRDPQLGTPGSGNHFVEVQAVSRVINKTRAWQEGIKEGDVLVTIHSGSRDVGFHVGTQWMDRAKGQWPKGVAHPEHGLYALEGELATTYLQAMGTASRYAWLNRFVIDELMRQAWSKTVGVPAWSLVVDVPHNVISREHGKNVHRKGATPAHKDQLGVIPGSMGDASYLVVGGGNPDWLWSCSHGAGRQVKRQAMRATANGVGAWTCLTTNEARKIEEHPSAYKPIGPVIDSQVEQGLIEGLVELRPLWTFKT